MEKFDTYFGACEGSMNVRERMVGAQRATNRPCLCTEAAAGVEAGEKVRGSVLGSGTGGHASHFCQHRERIS